MGDLSKQLELAALTEQNRFDFLRSDLALCFTFAALARTELEVEGPEAARRVLQKANEGCATVRRFLPDVEDPEHRSEIERNLNDLRTTIDDIQRQL